MEGELPPDPEVSVIVPVHDGADTLNETLEAILTQTHASLEVVVVDDGSTDDTPERLRAFAERDPRVRVIARSNAGVVAARTAGIDEARADIIAFCDHDDVWSPDKLERQLPLLEPGTLVTCDVVYVDAASGRPLGTFADLDREPERRARRWVDPLPEILAQNFVATPTVLLHRGDLEAAGGFRSDFGDAVEDWDLWIRCAERLRFACAEGVEVRVRRRSGGRNQRTATVRQVARTMLTATGDRLRAEGRLTATVRGSLGLGFFSSRNLGPAARWLAGALLRQPLHLRWWRWLAATALWRISGGASRDAETLALDPTVGGSRR